jgi:Hypothetical glycosyl hydrolase family 15
MGEVNGARLMKEPHSAIVRAFREAALQFGMDAMKSPIGARGRAILTVVAYLTAVATTPLGAGPAAAQGAPLPPIVGDRVGRAQIFDYHITDKADLAQRRDILWASLGPVVPGLYSTSYMTVDRDLDKSHDLAWYRANHPDWIVYGCDGQPTREFTGEYVTVDISNPDVREALFRQGVVEKLAKRPYDSIAVDNLSNWNGVAECGVRHNGAFQRLYSGQRSDPAFDDITADWMGWLAARVHARGLALTGNVYYDGVDREGYLKIARHLDVVLDETGFERHCRPSQTDAKWLDRVNLFREVASAKALMQLERVCPTLAEITPATIDWSFANYLFVKGPRTYLALSPEQNTGGIVYDFPELYLKIGRPLGEMQERGGVYFRRFERALALLNPSSRASARFDLGQEGWRDRVSGQVMSGAVDLPPASAMVLIKPGA